MPAQKIHTPLAADGLPHYGYVKLPQILAVIPRSRSAFLQFVQDGVYPRPYKIGPRTVAWKVEDIRAIMATFAQVSADTIDPNIAKATEVKAAKRALLGEAS